MWDKIAELTNHHGYMSGVDRMTDRVKSTGEVFTPTRLVIEMLQKILETQPEALAPGRTVLDPACGDGQFLVPAKWYKVLRYEISEEEALKDIYGVDIMRDNVDLCKKRLGGGNIIMGNGLDPYEQIPEQTEEEHKLMLKFFAEKATLNDFFA